MYDESPNLSILGLVLVNSEIHVDPVVNVDFTDDLDVGMEREALTVKSI